jgi:hypothetical protein
VLVQYPAAPSAEAKTLRQKLPIHYETMFLASSSFTPARKVAEFENFES